MSIIGSNILAGAAGSGVSAYEIEQSLRFDGSARLYRTQPASQTRTYSFWYKYSDLDGGNSYLFHHKNSDDSRYLGVRSGGSPSENQWQTLNQGSSFTDIYESRKYRDPSAWQHFVFKCTSSNVTQYVNGVEFASAGGANAALTGGTLEIGARSSAEYFGGYIAEFHLVDGTALDPDSFGEEDDNGVWRPIQYTGSYGSNGVYLKFDPDATNGIGHDHSGNGNNFTASGFTTSGTGTDVMSDTPTNNFCTFNPLDKDTSTPTNGNLNQPMPGRCAGTIAVNSGKWYWEAQYNAGNGYALGIGVADVDAYYPSEGFSNGIIYYGSTGTDADAGIYNFGTTDFTYDGAWSGGRIGIALDLDSATKTITFYRDGTNKGAVTIPSGKHGKYLTPIVQGGSGSTSGSWDLRMQSDLWTDSAPTGHKELCTANLPAPDIADGSEYFNTVLYTGDGASSNAITGVGFQPDWVWAKQRNSSRYHSLYDSVRGADLLLQSQTTSAEIDAAGTGVLSFDSDGFTVGSDSGVNQSSGTYVAWNWLGANGTSSNTDGSITSTVSASPSSGFSIVNFTGTGANATVGHGLGVAPLLLMIKNRDTNSSWMVGHQGLGSWSDAIFLDLNSAKATDSTVFNGTAPTSTVFSVGTNFQSNKLNDDLIAYCFAEVEGYSKFGSYTGNGSSDGPFVYCGFRPAWVLVKCSSTTGQDWILIDSARSDFNICNEALRPNTADTELTNDRTDFLSNGFKTRNTFGNQNTSGQTYIFAAFAENPFGGSGVSPATAR